MERRWNDTYHLTTNLFHRQEFREFDYFYHYGDYDMSYSVFDYIEFSFTPRRGEYRGRTTMTRAKKRPYKLDSLDPTTGPWLEKDLSSSQSQYGALECKG
nr:unnamed protein product [Haemonchus contortus]